MADVEKTPAQVAGPPATEEAPKQKGTLLEFLKGTTLNDPNVLGRDLLEKALAFDEAQLERDGVRVRRKLDFIVLPMVRPPCRGLRHGNRVADDVSQMMTTYMLSFLDKQTYVETTFLLGRKRR